MIDSEIPFGLSPREKKLLRRFASGMTDKQIAQELGDREERIAAQRQRIREKLQIQTDEQLVMLARRLANWTRRRKWASE
jgi:DNA-binding CsgD family transcriptional regulator